MRTIDDHVGRRVRRGRPGTDGHAAPGAHAHDHEVGDRVRTRFQSEPRPASGTYGE